MTMTDSLSSVVAHLRRLLADATPGPWRNVWGGKTEIGEESAIEADAADGWPVVGTIWHDGPRLALTKENCALICAAITHLPALLAAVDQAARLKAALRPLAAVSLEALDIEQDCRRTVLWRHDEEEVLAARLALHPKPEKGGADAHLS